MRKIGIIMVGVAATILLLSGVFIQIFKRSLMAWSPVCPVWLWPIVGIVFLFGVVGFVLGSIGD